MAKRDTHKKKIVPVDTLRLSERAQAEILAFMQRQEAGGSGANNRNNQRVDYVPEEKLTVIIYHPGGSTTCYLVCPRNLSPGGMNFLHGQFLYPGTACTLRLRTTDGRPVRVEGIVKRCNHVQGTIHEVGVQFETIISLPDYVINSPEESNETGEEAPLPQLMGIVLHIHKHAMDRDLIRHFLKLLGVEASSEKIPDEIGKLLDKTLFNAILVGDGHEDLIADIRKREYLGPIIHITDHEDAKGHQAVLSQGATRVLVKPFTASELGEALAEYLRRDVPQGGSEALVSANWSDVKMRPVILSFLAKLEEQAEKLDRLADDADVGALRDLSREIKGNAGSFGYPQISDKARELTQLALDDSPAEQWRAPLLELKELCERACVVRRKKDANKS